MSWRVLITARTVSEVGQTAIDLFRSAGCSVVISEKSGPLPLIDLLPSLEGIDAVLASADEYSTKALEAKEATGLKIISRWGVGYDSIDVPAATRQGIVVAFTPGLLQEAVADFAFALLLGITRRIPEIDHSMREGRWTPIWGCDLTGKTMGIIGCGRIGQAMARRAAGFGMRLLGFDVAPNPPAQALGIRFVPLEQLLAESDFVSLHAALTPQSRGLLGEAQLRRMKPTSYLVNTARGAMVDEAALLRALREGWIAGAALDTFAVEPLPADHPLRHAPNVVLAPHQASFGRETGERVSVTAARAIVDLLQGRRPEFVVNPDVFKLPALRARLAPM